MAETQSLEYWLSTSAVEFSGTKNVSTPAHGGAAKTTYVSSASLILRADHVQGPVTLQIAEGDLAETKFALNFSDDGRLTSSDVTAAGAGAQILGSVASIAGELVSVSSAVAKLAALAEVPGTAGPADEPRPYPQQDLLQKLVDRQNALTALLLTIGPTTQPDDHAKLAAIETALTLASQQLARLTQEKAAWTSASKTVTQIFDYILDVSKLPNTEDANAGWDAATHPAIHRVWRDLGIMVTLDATIQADQAQVGQNQGFDAPYQNGADTGIWFRQPRRVTLSVWSADEEYGPVPVRSSDVDVVDKHCRHLSLPLKLGHLFRKTEFSVTMGTYGTPTAIGTDVASGVAAALDAVAGAPKLYSAGLNDVAGLGTAWRTLHPSAESKEMATLQATKDRLQLLSDIAKLEQGG
jgi:hypothetical protein